MILWVNIAEPFFLILLASHQTIGGKKKKKSGKSVFAVIQQRISMLWKANRLSSHNKLFWAPIALHKDVLKLQEFSHFHSTSLAIPVPSNIIKCLEINSLVAWKAGTKVLN